MNVSRTAAFTAGAIFALVLGSGTAYAATGGDFHLGQHNTANKASTLINPRGIPLSLWARAGSPPLKVDRSVRIPRLNADLLDSRHESSFALASGSTGNVTGLGAAMSDGDSNGIPELIQAIATCPSGARRTGGGATDFTTGGTTFFNAPVGPSSWAVGVETDNVGPAAATDVTAYVVCYNPRGAVSSARLAPSRARVIAQIPPALERKMLARVALR